MKLFFVYSGLSNLADEKSAIMNATKEVLLSQFNAEEVQSPNLAEAIIIQEKNTFKDFRYINQLLNDPIISKYLHKVFTINTDDCATGLLRGLYTGLPKSRFNPNIFKSIPYMYFPNELAFSKVREDIIPSFLASWRGNIKSNTIRKKLIGLFKDDDRFCLELTNSWLDHKEDEKLRYVELIRSSKFSICPAGWAPVSFRIYESMALGRCPVIIADNFVPPSGPIWSDFAIFYPERKIAGLLSHLLQNEHLSLNLGCKALEAWNRFFSATVIKEYYASALEALIVSTTKTSRETEIKRLKSFDLHWDNKWTISQRALNRFNKIVVKYSSTFRKY